MSSSPFLNSLLEFMQVRRYSKRTIESYLYWIKYFIRYHGKRHPSELSASAVEQFLTHLATQCNVSASTQSIALNALVFLYDKFLRQPIGDVSVFRRSARQPKLPVVLTSVEIKALLDKLSGEHLLMAALLYGSGLRRIELLRLRVKDIDLDNLQIRVWGGKGGKHRLTTLAPELVPLLKTQIKRVEIFLEQDCRLADYVGVWMPDALARKYMGAAVLKQGAHGVRSPLSRLFGLDDGEIRYEKDVRDVRAGYCNYRIALISQRELSRALPDLTRTDFQYARDQY